MINTKMSMMKSDSFKFIKAIIFMACLVLQVVCAEHKIRCMQREREALLQFKAAIVDHYAMLSSWTTADCCQWKGIHCSNLTRHVLMLDLRGELNYERRYISGEIHKSLMELRQLKYLDLSLNSFSNREIPEFLGSLSNLRYLDLSLCSFGGKVPTQFGSLSHLKYLNLARNSLQGSFPCQLGNLSMLQHLDLSYNSFEGNIPSQLGNLSNLQELYLDHGGALKIDAGDQWLSNLISLTHLSFGFMSSLNSSNSWLQMIGKLPKLRELGLYDCSLSDHFILSLRPSKFNFSTSLSVLHLSRNTFTSPIILLWLSNVTSTSNSGTVMNSLEFLDLSYNQIIGSLPDLSVFSSLKFLDLYGNQLSGKIPEGSRLPLKLEFLSIASNSFEGVITDSLFANMSLLKSLDLSGNSLALEFSQNWVPSFQLFYVGLGSCKLGPLFPKWLQTQNEILHLDISNAGISDTVPKWFWTKLAVQQPIEIDLSYNNLQGMIPKVPPKNIQSFSLNLRSNKFEGPIPPFLRGFVFLDLSDNKFSLSDSHSFLCASGMVETLYQLDLSNNQLSGKIPDCWSHFKSLSYLNMSNNKFSGKIPTSMGSLLELQVLVLRNNNLTDEIPFTLGNCTKLVMLDMSENRLSGSIPAWIGGKLQELQILSLGRNNFYGSVPLQICYLKSIQLLDLSLNNLSGQIPNCIKNFSSMAQKSSSSYYPSHWYSVETTVISGNFSYELKAFLMWKGSEQMFMNGGLSLLKGIDLSSNHFSEEIPIEIENLLGLISLNLSRNHLTGKIPSNIGKLTSLEFLDLSKNQLVGSIPLSLTQIDRLSMLDLSHNNLSGKIPTGTQLQSFDASSYEDNLDLCGPPLTKLCINGKPEHEPIVKVDEDELLFTCEFYLSMTIGFLISFLGVVVSILIKRSWRDAYFKFISNLSDVIYVMVAVKVFKWQHRK